MSDSEELMRFVQQERWFLPTFAKMLSGVEVSEGDEAAVIAVLRALNESQIALLLYLLQ